jgi:hypothetical protein
LLPIIAVVSVAMPAVVIVVIIPVTIVVIISVSVVEIAVMIVVPTMIVFDPASFSGPVTRKEPFAVVMRNHPIGSLIRGACPVPLMPFVVMSHRIPIAFHPYELWCRCWWRRNVNHTRRWWRAD